MVRRRSASFRKVLKHRKETEAMEEKVRAIMEGISHSLALFVLYRGASSYHHTATPLTLEYRTYKRSQRSSTCCYRNIM